MEGIIKTKDEKVISKWQRVSQKLDPGTTAPGSKLFATTYSSGKKPEKRAPLNGTAITKINHPVPFNTESFLQEDYHPLLFRSIWKAADSVKWSRSPRPQRTETIAALFPGPLGQYHCYERVSTINSSLLGSNVTVTVDKQLVLYTEAGHPEHPLVPMHCSS